MCVAGARGYSCACPEGFSGTYCQRMLLFHGKGRVVRWDDLIVSCPSYLCQNGGRCQATDAGHYFCQCPPDFYGEQCEHGAFFGPLD